MMPLATKELKKEYDKAYTQRPYVKEAKREYMRTHRAERNAYRKNWRKMRGEKETEYTREQMRGWRANNREHFNAYMREWRKAHSEQSKYQDQKKKAKRRGAAGSHTYEQWINRVEFYGWACAYCRIGLSLETLTKDHAIPLARAGTDFAANLVPACGTCNATKRHKTPSEFRQYLNSLAAQRLNQNRL